MLKLSTILTWFLLAGFVASAQAGPLDSSDAANIDELPCGSICQLYMDWYRRWSTSRQTAPVSVQPVPPQLVQQSPKAKVERAIRRENSANGAARIAKRAVPKSVDVQPAKILDLPLANGGEAKSATLEKIEGSPPTTTPAARLDAGTTPEFATGSAAEEDLTTASVGPAPTQKAESKTNPSGPAEAVPPANAETAALASPDTAQLVAILLVRPDIKSVTDLANKLVAIDASRSDSVPSVRSALMAAGAAEVRMSEGERLALLRVIDRETPAAVISIGSPDDAKKWSGIPGLKLLLIPLSPPSERARGG